MELKWKIEAHPSSIKTTPALKEWFNRIVCTTDATLEIPINENIFYPVNIPADPAIKGVNNLMLIKAAFEFYFETEVNKNFLKCAKLSVIRGATTWYQYIDPQFRLIQTIKKLDEDEFMIVSYSKTGYSPPHPDEAPVIAKNAVELPVLCKSCYWMNVLDAKSIKVFKKGKQNCVRCEKVLVDVIKNGVY
jgi:hypothetical protein